MGNFLGKRKGETVEQEKPAAALSSPNGNKRRKISGTNDDDAPGAGVCDDVLLNIFARLPARAVVACMALSKHHRRLICSPEFRSLHYRLGAPLPHPHIAYVVTKPIKRRPKHKDRPISMFHGFHVAGAGLIGNAMMRAIAGAMYLDTAYVNTCNGIVLLARQEFSDTCRCILWNPAITDLVEEVTIPNPLKRWKYLMLGLAYNRRSQTYKLLLCRKEKDLIDDDDDDDDNPCKYCLVIYELGDVNKQPTVLTEGQYEGVGQNSLYMDGTIYLCDTTNSVILALDVDHETVTSISMPIPLDIQGKRIVSKLMELSGQPCVAINNGDNRALWMLTRDHQWNQRCLIAELQNDSLSNSILGIWEHGNVLVLYVENIWYGNGYLLLYNVTTDYKLRADLPCDIVPDWLEEYAFCWGYRPTLVSPMSIVGKLKQGKESSRERPLNIMEALVPINEQYKKKRRKATLDVVCFMDFLVRIMQKLPHDMQDVVEMQMMDSEDLLFKEAIPFEDEILEVDY